MKPIAKPALEDPQTIRLLPRWVTLARDETPDTVAFASGAALATLDIVLRDPAATLPVTLLRDRMALRAAVACLKLEGRTENAADIRDAICLARPGDALGPAGEKFLAWRKLALINPISSGGKDRVGKLLPEQVAEVMPEFEGAIGSPVAQAAHVLVAVLEKFPRQEAAALMLGDVTLARALGWNYVLPLLATHLKRADIRAIANDPLPLVHRAVIGACDTAIRNGADLSHRAAKLNAIAPKLRAKGAGSAVELFLSHDAVSPSGMLSPTIKGTSVAMTDRAARRLCDRLVELGVVRELTGRATFRLYGI